MKRGRGAAFNDAVAQMDEYVLDPVVRVMLLLYVLSKSKHLLVQIHRRSPPMDIATQMTIKLL